MGARRRAWAAPADPPEIVRALLGRVGGFGEAGRQGAALDTREVEHGPMDEVAGIRIVDHQHERGGPGRRTGPREVRRDVVAVTCETRRDLAARYERRAG